MLMPFALGDVKWLPVPCPERVTVPCPVCVGQCSIGIILGSGEHLRVPCEGCGLGFNGPRGVIEEYVYAPRVVRFEIAGVKSLYDNRWTVVSTEGSEAEVSTLHDTEEAALEAARTQCQQQYERNMETRQAKRKATKTHGWSVRYHREQIKDLERQIGWHKQRLDKKG